MDVAKDSAVNLNKQFLHLIKLFHYTGLSTYSTSNRTNNWLKWWHLKWCFFNMVFFSAVHFIIIYFHRELFYIGDKFGAFNDFFKVVTVGTTHVITLIESAYHRKSELEFYQTYTYLHKQWTDYKNTKNEIKIYKKFFLLTLSYILVQCLIEFNYIYEVRLKPQWILFFIAYEPSVWICRFRFLQIAMYLTMITMETVQLNREIMALARDTEKKQENYDDTLICQKLHDFMRKYQQIFSMVELLKRSCSISFLIIFIMSYVKTLSDSYWSYWVIYNQIDISRKISFFLL